MAEEVKNVIVSEEKDNLVKDTFKRIGDIKAARAELESLKSEFDSRQKSLEDTEKIYGKDSKKYAEETEYLALADEKIAEAEKKVDELSYKRSELKPALDAAVEVYDKAYRAANLKEYHVELVSPDVDDEGNATVNPVKGKKVFKQLLDYLYHNVRFSAKSATSLIYLVVDMEKNKAWVNAKNFDNVIILKSASVAALWRFINDDLEGKGFYEAKTFLECWGYAGESLRNALTGCFNDNTVSRDASTWLTAIDEEFSLSENDIPEDEQETTKDEVAPDLSE